MSNYLRIRNDAKPSLGYICVAACYYFKCYQVQAHFSHHMIGQQIQEMSCWGKEYDFIQRADWQRRWQTKVSKSLSCWGPWCQVFLWIRDGERQGNNVKSPFNSCRYLWERHTSGRGILVFFPNSHSQVSRVRLSPCELNKSTLRVRQRGQDSLRQAIMYDFNNKNGKNKVIVIAWSQN